MFSGNSTCCMFAVCCIRQFPFVLKTNKHCITKKMQEVKIKSCQRKTTQLKYRYLKILQTPEVFVLSYFPALDRFLLLCCSSERLKLEAVIPPVSSRGQRFTEQLHSFTSETLLWVETCSVCFCWDVLLSSCWMERLLHFVSHSSVPEAGDHIRGWRAHQGPTFVCFLFFFIRSFSAAMPVPLCYSFTPYASEMDAIKTRWFDLKWN